ncbi:MAG: UbiA family prenyltransferase [Phycisphaerales bacterium]|nr:UbiA family prenyltransferase [Phycisphaerales bacterium]
MNAESLNSKSAAAAPKSPLVEAARTVAAWGEMIKFSHSVFALPFAVLASFLATRPAVPTAGQLGLIVLCMVAARSAAMTFNRIVDATIDAKNPRTAIRALPRGLISRGAALGFFIGASGIFILAAGGFWVWFGNAWPVLLSPVVLVYLCLYSFTKRFTRWSHLVLGSGIAFAPVAAWIALNPATLGAPAWLLMLAVTFWIAGFDLIYACQDVEFDRGAGLHSVPAKLGVAAALWTARVFHVLTVASLLGVGWFGGMGAYYFAGVACVAVLLFVENSIVSSSDLSRVNLAFFTVNGVIGLLLGGLGIVDILVK